MEKADFSLFTGILFFSQFNDLGAQVVCANLVFAEKILVKNIYVGAGIHYLRMRITILQKMTYNKFIIVQRGRVHYQLILLEGWGVPLKWERI